MKDNSKISDDLIVKIKELVIKYPNDYDLGKNVRQLIINHDFDDELNIWDNTLLDGLDDLE